MKRTLMLAAIVLALAGCGSNGKGDLPASDADVCLKAARAGEAFTAADVNACQAAGPASTYTCSSGEVLGWVSSGDDAWIYRQGAAPVALPSDDIFDSLADTCP